MEIERYSFFSLVSKNAGMEKDIYGEWVLYSEAKKLLEEKHKRAIDNISELNKRYALLEQKIKKLEEENGELKEKNDRLIDVWDIDL